MLEYINLAAILLFLIVVGKAVGLNYLIELKKTLERLEPLNNILEFLFKLPNWLNYYNELEDNRQDLSDKMFTLYAKAEDIRREASADEHRTGKQRKIEVTHWLENVNTMNIKVQVILQQGNRDTNFFFKFLYRAYLGSRVNKKIQQVQELLELGTSLQGIPLLSSLEPRVKFLARRLIGRSTLAHVDRILALVRTSEVSRIGVQGGEGTGKTEMMKHVYNELVDDENVYYVHIKDRSNITVYDIQSAIAWELKLELPEDEMRRQSFLSHALKKQGRFVLILDGLEKSFIEEDIGVPVHPNGGKLIITTRSPNVCRRMGCDRNRTIALQALADDDADELFRSGLHLERYSSTEMEDIARRIIHQCQNIPGTILQIADELRGEVDLSVWSHTLNKLS